MFVAMSELSMWCKEIPDKSISVNELMRAFRTELADLGVCDIAYLHMAAATPSIAYTTYSAAWCDYYIAKRLVASDPTVGNALKEVMPFFWDVDRTVG